MQNILLFGIVGIKWVRIVIPKKELGSYILLFINLLRVPERKITLAPHVYFSKKYFDLDANTKTSFAN